METILTTKLAAANLPEAPRDTNGTNIFTDFSTTATFVPPEHKLVVNAENHINLRDSIARSIWVKSGASPTKAAVTAPDILAAKAVIACHIARFEMMIIASHMAGLLPGELGIRKADTVSAAVWDTVPEPVRTSHGKAADAIMAALAEDESLAVAFKLSGRYTALCLIANAICREHMKGHNWLSDTTPRSSTPGGKALAIAGADIQEFSDFMEANGHNLFHFLPDVAINLIAVAITGHRPIVTDIALTIAGQEYAAATKIADIFKIDDSAKDRYPPGQLGRSAAILATRVFKAVVIDLYTRKPTIKDEVDALLEVFNKYEAYVGRDDFTRDEALVIKNVLKKPFAFCYGYAMEFSTLSDQFSKNKSLEAWANQEAGEMIIGSNVGQWAKGTRKDDNAIGEMAEAFIRSITEAMGNLALGDNAHPAHE